MWTRFYDPNVKRRRWLRRVHPNPMQAYLSVPLPDPRTQCRDAKILALDLETTGLNPSTDRILSIGCVVIRELGIDLETAWHQVIRVDTPLQEDNVIVHRITDDESARGMPLRLALPELLERLAGKVLLAHHATLELRFLDRLCRTWYGTPLIVPVIDTQVLARRRRERRNQAFKATELRLSNLREAYGLPRYRAHHALSDALATAELFLAMLPDEDCRLSDALTKY